MPLFQKAPTTPEELEASKPLEIPPEEVLKFDEATWYQRAYRGHDAPQLTLRAVVMGTVLGFFLSFTNIYIGLKTGWFLSVNLTACILSFAIWNALKGVGAVKGTMTILENNCTQSTASSAGYATGHIIVTAVPAILMLSIDEAHPKGVQMAWPVMIIWVFFLAVLGVVLGIPMKRNMINREKLTFPSGTAAAVTLQGLYSRGSEALAKARALFLTAIVGALVPLLKDLNVRKVTDAAGKVSREGLLPGHSNVFDWIPKILPFSPHALHAAGKEWKLSDYQLKLDHSLALVFAGMIVGIRITFWMVFGSLILTFLIAPPALEAPWTNAAGKIVSAATKPGSAWKEIGIWCGAPLLVAGGLTSFALQWRTIVRAFSGLLGTKNDEELPPGAISPKDVEVPAKWFVSGLLFAGLGVVVTAHVSFDIPIVYGVLAVAMTFVLSLVAARATGESDITPSGAMGKIMQLTYGVLIPQNATANLMTAAVTAGAAGGCSDLLNDLKSGYLLGANPRRQFLAQALGIVTGTLASTLCYFILVPDASVLLGDNPAFPAPGAQQWKAVAEVFKHGLGNLHPMSRAAIPWGLGVGILLSLIETFSPTRLRKFVPSPTGLGLGLILPFFYPFAMFLGAVFAEVANRVNKTWADKYVIPIAAGGIAGESIIGVIVAGVNNFWLV